MCRWMTTTPKWGIKGTTIGAVVSLNGTAPTRMTRRLSGARKSTSKFERTRKRGRKDKEMKSNCFFWAQANRVNRLSWSKWRSFTRFRSTRLKSTNTAKIFIRTSSGECGVLVDANQKLGIPLQNENQNRINGQQLLLFNDSSHIDKHNFNDLKPMLSSLWNDAGIQEAFERRNEYQLTDSVGYFFQHLDRIASPGYTPNKQDILRARKATRGIHEFPLTIKKVPFVFIDVGGQRTERAKWFHCFDKEANVKAILFLASMSEFDQRLMEFHPKNRLEESVDIFNTIVNHHFFARMDFILFLNKEDLLREKVGKRRSNISQLFPEKWSESGNIRRITGEPFGCDPFNAEDVKVFILYFFLSKMRNRSEQHSLIHHYTTAVDTENIERIFRSVKDIILKKNMQAMLLQ